jgi:hypothetical protein
MPTLCRFIAGTCLSIGALLITAAAQQTYNSQLHRFQTETVATGLKQPSAMIFLPDGTALLVERQKGIARFDPRSNKLTPLEAPDALIGTDTGAHDANRPATLTGEDAGFHDIILHPDYAKNGWIYLTYSDGPRERSTTVVDRFHLRDNKLVDRQRIFTADAWSEDRFHYGGRMAFIDGYLYLTVGDRHHQDRAQATECDAAPEQLQVLALQGVALVRGVDGVAVLLLDAGQIRAAGRVDRAAVFGSERRQSQRRRRHAGDAGGQSGPEECRLPYRTASCRG